MWLRHASAPLLWIHPIAKNHVFMPKGDSNAIFDSSGIFIVGTCPPMKMVRKFAFSTVCAVSLRGHSFFVAKGCTLRYNIGNTNIFRGIYYDRQCRRFCRERLRAPL